MKGDLWPSRKVPAVVSSLYLPTSKRAVEDEVTSFCSTRACVLRLYSESSCTSDSTTSTSTQIHQHHQNLRQSTSCASKIWQQESIIIREQESFLGPSDRVLTFSSITSAADKVFRNLDTAEAILMDQPMLDIWHLQTITFTCVGAVKAFSPLRRALFLKPYDGRRARLDDLERYFKIADCASIEDCDGNEANENTDDLTLAPWAWEPPARKCDIVLNPMFTFFNERKPDGSEISGEYEDTEFDWPLPYDFAAMEALGHPSSKFEVGGDMVAVGHLSSKLEYRGLVKSMLFTQPPLAILVVEDLSAEHSHVLRPEVGTEGITIRQVQRHLEAFPNAVGEQYIWRLDGLTILPVTLTGAEITAEVKAAMGLK